MEAGSKHDQGSEERTHSVEQAEHQERLGLPALLGDHAARIVGKLERTLPNFPFQDEAKAFTLQEVAQGLAHGPYTKADLDKAHGSNSWIPMRRFMLPQSSKLRAIDDGRFSGHNHASYAEETIFVSSPDCVSAACKFCLELLSESEGNAPPWAQPFLGTSDMSAAYRQIPNHPEEAAATIVAYFDREADELRYAALKAHPYGLASAVLNFNRTPCFLTALTRRVAAACAANYFDDSGALDFISARGSAQSFLWQAYTPQTKMDPWHPRGTF